MTMNESDTPKSKRRWYQFSLRTLLVFVGLFLAGCGPSKEQQAMDAFDRSIDLTVTQAQLDAQAHVLVQLPEGRTITVELARSMVDGCYLRLSGLGVEGKGDLYIRMHVTNQE